MPGLLPNVDPDGLMEYSVVYTDRALNHMSLSFQQVMKDISHTLKEVYNAEAVAVVPGSGTFGMEAVARQFAQHERCLIIRNGWFSYRWSQILDMGGFAGDTVVCKARKINNDADAPFIPAPVEEVVAEIRKHKPGVVFAPHVETSAGMMLPDDYMKQISAATHEVGGLFVLDCIASGTVWVDMQAAAVDVLISAPQKGWSATPCAGLVMLNKTALTKIETTTSNSFACDLKKWLQIMQAYENGGHAYHATMPTDGLSMFRNVMLETVQFGLSKARDCQIELGSKVRELLESKGVKSVAAAGFQAPGVVVSYTNQADIQNGKQFAARGIQIAAGVPLMCDEPKGFQTFRFGLFGLDKLENVQRTVDTLSESVNEIFNELETAK